MSKTVLNKDSSIIIQDGQDQFNEKVIKILSYLSTKLLDSDEFKFCDEAIQELATIKDNIIKDKNSRYI